MPFGGGGALHSGAMMDEVGLARSIVPRYPGVTSAMGCVIADMRQDFVQTINAALTGIDLSALTSFMQTHVDSGLATLDASRTHFEGRDTEFTLDMAYLGQTHTVSVPLPVTVTNGRVTPPTEDEIATAFDTAYRATYGRLLDNGTRRVINLRSAITGRRPRFDLATLAPQGGTIEAAFKGTRDVHFAGAWHETKLYRRLELPVGAEIPGPAILEQPDTTVLIEPGLVGKVDAYGNTLIERATT